LDGNDSIKVFFFSSRRRHTRFSRDWSSDVCSSDLERAVEEAGALTPAGGTQPEAGSVFNNGGAIFAAKGFKQPGNHSGQLQGHKIGRASCREGVEVSMVAGAGQRTGIET